MKPKEGYKGVSWDSKKKKWRVRLTKGGITYLDTFVDEEREGVMIRDVMILKKSLNVPVQILTKPKIM